MLEDYGVTASEYLTRCAERLKESTASGLFYAALELRCCIEAKMQEYLELYEPFKGKKVRPYKLKENAETIRGISQGQLIAEVSFFDKDQLISRSYHTPIPESLKGFVLRDNDHLRHSQPKYRSPNDPWWISTRENLISAYRSAWIACQGDLAVPPLYDKKTNTSHPLIFRKIDRNIESIERLVGLKGVPMIIAISYLKEPPPEWICDL